MSWYGKLSNKVKEKVNNIIKTEDGFGWILENIESQPKDLINKLNMDQIIFDRSKTIDRIYLKLQKVEGSKLDKHADSYDDVGEEFYHDLLLEIDNINNI